MTHTDKGTGIDRPTRSLTRAPKTAHEAESKPSSSSFGALIHSLKCLADRSAEAGLHGNAEIARQAASVLGNVGKLVTCFLPAGMEMHHPARGTMAVVSHALHSNGRVTFDFTTEDGFFGTCFADECEPIYELKTEPVLFVRGYERDVAEFDRSGPATFDRCRFVQAAGAISGLACKQCGGILAHEPGCIVGRRFGEVVDERHNPHDDEFPTT